MFAGIDRLLGNDLVHENVVGLRRDVREHLVPQLTYVWDAHMRRQPQPWYRKANDAWYVTLEEDQILLCHGYDQRDAAYVEYYRLMASRGERSLPGSPREILTLNQLRDKYLDHHKDIRSAPSTLKNLRWCLGSLCKLHGHLPVNSLKTSHVEAWVAAHPNWNQTTEFKVKTDVISLFRWAKKSKLIKRNPLKGLKKPAPLSRGESCVITPEQHQKLCEKARPLFRDFLVALYESGARPGEVARVTAADFDEPNRCWRLTAHKTRRKRGKDRVIYLTPALVELTKLLAAKHPTGPLFRNSRGNPWDHRTIGYTMKRLAARCGLGRTICYGYRHAFATDALERGVPDTHVAELLGHDSTQMVHRHYAHLSSKTKALRDALGKTRECQSGS